MDRYLQRAHDALQQAAGGLTLDKLTARPPNKWTIGDILEHLSRAYSHTAAGAQRAISVGRPTLEDVFLHITGRAFRDDDGGAPERDFD